MKTRQLVTSFAQRDVFRIGKCKSNILAAFVVMAMFVISGCAEGATSEPATDEYGVPVFNDTSVPADYSVESFMEVGQKVKIWYLHYSPPNNYHVGLRGSDKQLKWFHVRPVAVYLEEDIETSYIERQPDRKNTLTQTTAYVLHIKVGTPIYGGEITNENADSIITGGK